MKNKEFWKSVIQLAISVLTAALTAISTTSCMGHGPIYMWMTFPLLGGLSVYLSFGRINPIGFRSSFAGSLDCSSANAILMASSISKSLLAIRSLEFELVSDAHELNAICSKFLFQPSPIVTSFHIVILIINGTHDIRSRKLINIISRSMNND